MKPAIALCSTILVFAVSLTGCGSCTLYQRHTGDPVDPEPWFLVEICREGTPQQTTKLLCTSKMRLKVGARDCQ